MEETPALFSQPQLIPFVNENSSNLWAPIPVTLISIFVAFSVSSPYICQACNIIRSSDPKLATYINAVSIWTRTFLEQMVESWVTEQFIKQPYLEKIVVALCIRQDHVKEPIRQFEILSTVWIIQVIVHQLVLKHTSLNRKLVLIIWECRMFRWHSLPSELRSGDRKYALIAHLITYALHHMASLKKRVRENPHRNSEISHKTSSSCWILPKLWHIRIWALNQLRSSILGPLPSLKPTLFSH